jgi:hypothetical protein
LVVVFPRHCCIYCLGTTEGSPVQCLHHRLLTQPVSAAPVLLPPPSSCFSSAKHSRRHSRGRGSRSRSPSARREQQPLRQQQQQQPSRRGSQGVLPREEQPRDNGRRLPHHTRSPPPPGSRRSGTRSRSPAHRARSSRSRSRSRDRDRDRDRRWVSLLLVRAVHTAFLRHEGTCLQALILHQPSIDMSACRRRVCTPTYCSSLSQLTQQTPSAYRHAHLSHCHLPWFDPF